MEQSDISMTRIHRTIYPVLTSQNRFCPNAFWASSLIIQTKVLVVYLLGTALFEQAICDFFCVSVSCGRLGIRKPAARTMIGLTRKVVCNGASRAIVQRGFRHETWVSGAPRVRISQAEKFGHMLIIFAATLTFPMYVAVNIKHYRRDDWENDSTASGRHVALSSDDFRLTLFHRCRKRHGLGDTN